jgi:L-ribulose-5-phosphate 3-epimerase UlaE
MDNIMEDTLKELLVKESELKSQLEYWESYPPVNNMGKWARQTKLDRLSERLQKVQEKIQFHNTLYLSNEIHKQWKDVK